MKIFLVLSLLAAGAAVSQREGAVPSVAEVISEVDRDGDGKLSREEAQESARARSQFPRWDRDGDGFATGEEIIAMRREFGIDAAGNRIGGRDPENRGGNVPAKLTIPTIEAVTRVDGTNRATRREMQWSLTILKTEPHEVTGRGYLILTDHDDEAWLRPLRQLADHRDGEIIRVADLATIHADKEGWEALRSRLNAAAPRFVAIAPRLESYREKMLAGMWKLLRGLDDDPQLDVLPGLLVAPDAASFESLVSGSIGHRPIPGDAMKVFAQCHFTDTSAGGIKSLQKVGILREHFATLGHETSCLIVAAQRVREERPLPGDDVLYAVPSRRLLESFPAASREDLAQSSLLVMFGHGSPGMSCGVKVDAFHELDLTGKVVMAGSCWSAAPVKLDFPMPRRDAAGTDLEENRERFLMRAVENGAVVAFGHMRLNRGFPVLYPVLEEWLGGGTVGEAYQQLMNAIFAMERQARPEDLLVLDPARGLSPDARGRSPAIPGNQFLYVIIGDPALQPFEGVKSTE